MVAPDLQKWYVDKKHKAKGEYEISHNKKITFRSGAFGGINELIKNVGHDTRRRELQKAIADHKQGRSLNTEQINVAEWTDRLRNDKPDFDKYFLIEFIKPDYYQLFRKVPKKAI